MDVDSQPPHPPVTPLACTRYLPRQDLFWPRIELANLRQRLALPAWISDTRLQLAGQQALAVAAREFASWRLRLRALGYTQLDQLSGHAHGLRLCTCYRRLVERCTLRALGGRANVRGTCNE
ncbi:head completion/stabilization protein [Pseudomonas plecoglossicida]|uniref:head completion/stabilization protein n=1 Tax=Pseudomonas plecoglossicida TaxID=70775 RepID=UPI0015E428E7|nr:head completion/stabilization protein [Pseudomonas plecoglossicida]MBA1324600.1 head completion/stabilization protein [Pseudomonas plecoglossicida]